MLIMYKILCCDEDLCLCNMSMKVKYLRAYGYCSCSSCKFLSVGATWCCPSFLGSLMVHNSDDKCDINDSAIKLCSEKPESHENVMRVPSLGETQSKGVGGGTMSSSLMLKGKELEDKREQAVYDAGQFLFP